jgi:FtsP/CotA-like multicopper oxidase with cupredoxin domain
MHGHGMHVPAEMDGNVHQPIPPGKSWSARYRVDQNACTNWYHPHTMGRTAAQVMMGLGGVILIEDENSLSLPLPQRYGKDDIPLVLQDRRFTREGAFAYSRGIRTMMHGFLGDTLLVNGTLAPYLKVDAGRVRLRILNASNARIYRVAVEGISDMILVAGDNSFL